ncbi:MAG: S46 family peptidase [Porphyromonadaceae bacterium]|nr:MAG: S46 family peptidase [Porphyromonadaceae bacterium]
MKRFTSVLLGIALLFSLSAKADEGMWLLPLIQKLNIGKMTELGLQLSAEDIYSVNHSSVKDAILIFGGGCTAEVVSPQGLVLTNHHCGYGSIQYHSTVEHDYLTDGFWAMSKGEELSTPNLSVTFLDYIQDVTARINAKLTDGMSEADRSAAIRDESQKIQSEIKTDEFHSARVSSFFGGNQFFLLVYTQYRDVRLVGAPPSSVGKFGADTDNWMWPRQTGDFSVFRIYMSPDGNPAGYSKDNVPLKPKHYLPVSVKGVKEGDFTMILGYPGRTTRYMTSFEVEDVLKYTHPNRIKIRGAKQEIMLADMLADPEVKIQYSSKYSGSTNYYKKSIGESAGLKRLKVADRKKELEDQFTKWIAQDPGLQKKYGDALSLIKTSIEGRAPYNHVSQYFSECFNQGSEIVGLAGRQGAMLKGLLESGAAAKIKETAQNMKKNIGGFYKDYNMPTDKKVTAALMLMFKQDIDPAMQPDIYQLIDKKFKGSTELFTEKMFATSIFADQAKFEAFLDNPSLKVLEKDLAYIAASSINKKSDEIRGEMGKFMSDLAKGQRLWIDGLMAMEKDRVFYPDANSTMRLSYGSVKSYDPMDAVHYKYFTTLDGVMQKEVPGDWEFDVPAKLKELYKAKDYGIYGEGGVMKIGFISNNDITGGNSGSPVLNAKGELLGLAFDGNWEALSGDIAFEPDLQRTISVDIRYVLFIMDKYAGAKHLVDEMTLTY